MNILKNIKNWFTKTSHVEDNHQSNEDENSITFSIDGFGKPWVYLSLSNTDQKSCEHFAKMLAGINAGEYEQNILDILVSLSKEKPSMSTTIQTILYSWAILLSKSDVADKPAKNNDNRPFIRPRNVFLGPDK